MDKGITKNKSHRGKIGVLGEGIAAQFLEKKGFKIVERNYWKPWGEIDIIAEKDGVVHFVEVKTVTREMGNADVSHAGPEYRPEEQIHPTKLHKVGRTAEMYMNNKGDHRDFQVDALGVLLDVPKKVAQCRLFEQVL